ncbi:hormonally up-regulated neu tumor-associated kinase homolog A [Ceratina calcarata]|uniref:Hormonally up-regulated neu tumor-associated kinase homolog A n=1 Tax=Ceratina calcarata TaxID=156304 RepID=A0AAJ7WBH4_9HYME|nr:hormonally up-regulated neu tumor-associated kinase homolog A [Ceratina calcarata]XP_026670265.1 hormonally up-regulated neu tumor-associated kinase homolog A [Ceratina calcarata]XP_026670266.1 hormonally up-regulated neu tumor-associated kinase homolog A [Ceratina calcarata]XP_026670267.1 hormonally up-regulated neu tumor-associated kinase homolog A [Ceratina calcarata]XP_026670268.1 hormonally up-regulated neu tumor-associated kinase homolog A [Ceratina calcarata]
MSLMKKAIGGSIHRIREFELEKVNLIDEFDILQIVGEGWFGKILLTEHRSTQTEMVLKALPKAYTGLSDFFREFHYGLHLAAHRNIITTYDVAFETAGFYVFSQEYAPLGDLTSNVTETGLGEFHAKRVAKQLAAAVHHIHSRELVHRDIKLDNVLVFRSDFSRIKLCDFGETRRVNTVVRRHNEWLPYSPPEVLQIDTDETYKALTSHDVWQFGIVLFVCLTGCLPWQKAASDDPRYTRYLNWHNATLNIAKKPKLFQLISSRAQRMFKRLLDPKAEKRPVSVLEVNKYLEDRWLAKLGAEKAMNGGADERDELCPSMYSFHSSLEEKNQLLHTLTTYGIETTVDRVKKKDRIREWIQASTIVEEYEEDESDLNGDVRVYEDEDEEPSSMKGRHFPETRPVIQSESRRHRRKSDPSAPRKRQPVKRQPTERRIPFAPQVAEERETVARFASFPNGDPNWASMKNGTNGNVVPPLELPVNTEAVEEQKSMVNGQVVNNSTPNNSQENSTRSKSNLREERTVERANSRDFKEQTVSQLDERSSPRSPQIPTRKHRSQTAPFPGSPVLNGSRADPAKRSYSTAVLAQSDPTIGRSAERSSLPDDQSARGEGSTPRAEHRSATQSMSRVENQSAVMPPPATAVVAATAAVRVENQLSNALPVTRNEKTGPAPLAQTNPLTMSVASHLVMQSFNVLQGMNPGDNGNPVANVNLTPKNSPSSTPNKMLTPKNSPTTTPARTSTPPKQKNHKIEETVFYGKDPFEHYGIAQGAILRGEAIRQGSMESGNRSASN